MIRSGVGDEPLHVHSSRRHTRTPIATRDARVAGCYEQGSSPEDGPSDVLGRWRGSALAGLEVVGRVHRPGLVSLRSLRSLALDRGHITRPAPFGRFGDSSLDRRGLSLPLVDLLAVVRLRIDAEVIGFRTLDGRLPSARVGDLLGSMSDAQLVLGASSSPGLEPTGPIELHSRLFPSPVGGLSIIGLEVRSFDEFVGPWS